MLGLIASGSGAWLGCCGKSRYLAFAVDPSVSALSELNIIEFSFSKVIEVATVHLCSIFILHFDTLFLLKWVACHPSEAFLDLNCEFFKADLELV
jgi:hypothetical protein